MLPSASVAISPEPEGSLGSMAGVSDVVTGTGVMPRESALSTSTAPTSAVATASPIGGASPVPPVMSPTAATTSSPDTTSGTSTVPKSPLGGNTPVVSGSGGALITVDGSVLPGGGA